MIKPVNPDVLRNGLLRTARRRQIELRLREEREFAEKILQTAEAIVLVMDPEGRIIRFNPYLENLTGYRCEDCVGQSWLEIFVPEAEREKARRCFEESTTSSELRAVVHPILAKDGRRCEVRWSNTTLKNSANQVTAALCIGLDITDLVHTQQQLLQAERLAAIGETVAGLAHESRNALQRIRSGIEVLEQTCSGNSDVLKDLRRIDKAAEDLRILLDEVRSYAAPILLERQSIHLARVWQQAWAHLKQTVGHRPIQLEEHVMGTLRPVMADPRKLESVFRNLFQNSLECSTGPVHVELTCSQNSSGTRIAVTDHGPGLDSQQVGKIFKAFFTTKATGTGLGLAICRRIVEAHGGSIQVASAQREGSRLSGACFVIWLPSRTDT
jgi:PAS domain S-box-containing protein